MQLDGITVWVAGARGRVGKEICRLLDTKQMEVLETDLEDVDITDAKAVRIFADMHRPNLVINCAGMTDVLACEQDRDGAFKSNALGPRNLSAAARKINARIVQISTDDVFDGNGKSPYNEFDVASPLTVYGKSKLAGEGFVRDLCPRHVIIRSSWIYGVGKSFVTDVLEKAEAGETVEAANNQFASPTSAKELAKAILRILREGDDGVYHAVCAGYCSRYEFAQEIIRLSRKAVEVVPTIDEEDAVAKLRPSYSVLDNMMLRIGGVKEPVHWKDALKEYMVWR